MHLFHQIQGSKQWSRGKLGGVLKGNALESRLRGLRFAKILFSLYSGVEMGDSKTVRKLYEMLRGIIVKEQTRENRQTKQDEKFYIECGRYEFFFLSWDFCTKEKKDESYGDSKKLAYLPVEDAH